MTDLVTNDAPARPDSFTVLERTITVKPLNALSEGQVLGFMKIFNRYVNGEVTGSTMVKLDQALSKLLEPADNDWLDFQVMENKVAWTDVLIAVLPCLRRDDVVTAPVKPAARAKKVAKKAAAKKAPVKRARKSA